MSAGESSSAARNHPAIEELATPQRVAGSFVRLMSLPADASPVLPKTSDGIISPCLHDGHEWTSLVPASIQFMRLFHPDLLQLRLILQPLCHKLHRCTISKHTQAADDAYCLIRQVAMMPPRFASMHIRNMKLNEWQVATQQSVS